MSTELKIDKARVLAEAEKCPTFKNIAKGLWPEVFEDDTYFNLVGNTTVYDNGPIQILIAHGLAPSHLDGKCFHLTRGVNWCIKGDLLIPTRKY